MFNKTKTYNILLNLVVLYELTKQTYSQILNQNSIVLLGLYLFKAKHTKKIKIRIFVRLNVLNKLLYVNR